MIGCWLAMLMPWLTALGATGEIQKDCRSIQSDSARLACYDRVADHAVVATHAPAVTAPDRDSPLLDVRWQLTPANKTGTFKVVAYQPVYALPVYYMSSVNGLPQSPNPDNTVTSPFPYQDTESLFQLSLKTKLWQNVIGDYSDLWFAYTQDSHWQVYNANDSSPFRETDYMPELMWAFRTHYTVAGWHGALASISFSHQSNGEPDPTSRSWNRIIGTIGLEKNGWVITLRPWVRVPEAAATDNNPDILRYMGNGEVSVTRDWGKSEVSLLMRHSFGANSHGAVGFEWAFPLMSRMSGYFRVFNGYGESIIDYNHNATYVGIGVSLVNHYPAQP